MEIERKPLTVKQLIDEFQKDIAEGELTGDELVWIAADEEGNSYSPIVVDGITFYTIEEKGNIRTSVHLYPLFPTNSFEE